MRILFCIIVTFCLLDTVHAAELTQPIYDEEGKMFNYKDVYLHAAPIFKDIKKDHTLRLNAAKQLIETSKYEENEWNRFGALGAIILSDHKEGRLLAIDEVKIYMKTSKSYFSNYLTFLHIFPGFDLSDEDSSTKKIHNLIDIIELIGSDREITGEPRETLISTLKFIQFASKDLQKTIEERIKTLEERTKFRSDLAKVIARVDEVKAQLQR